MYTRVNDPSLNRNIEKFQVSCTWDGSLAQHLRPQTHIDHTRPPLVSLCQCSHKLGRGHWGLICAIAAPGRYGDGPASSFSMPHTGTKCQCMCHFPNIPHVLSQGLTICHVSCMATHLPHITQLILPSMVGIILVSITLYTDLITPSFVMMKACLY